MDTSKIGSFIKELLDEKGITQAKLAEALGISSSAVSQNLSGKSTFDLENLKSISRLLDVSLDRITNGGEEPETELERISKLSVEEFNKHNSYEKLIKTTDRKGVSFYEYCFKHQNTSLLKKYMNSGVVQRFKGNLGLLGMFVRENDLATIEYLLKSSNYSFVNLVNRSSKENTKYNNLTDNEKFFVQSVKECTNTSVLNKLPIFELSRENRKTVIPMHEYSIVLRSLEMVEFIEKLYINQDEQRNSRQDQIADTSLLKIALRYSSGDIAEYYYNAMNEFKMKDYYEDLFESRDNLFISKMLDVLKNKTKNRGYGNVTLDDKTIECSKLILSLISEGETEAVKLATSLYNDIGLDNVLKSLKEENLEWMLYFISEGATFTYRDGYSGHDVKQEGITAVIRHLLLEKSK